MATVQVQMGQPVGAGGMPPQQQQPQTQTVAPKTEGNANRFSYVNGYRDPIFLGIFLVHLIIMIALTGAYGQKTVDLFNSVPPCTGCAAEHDSSVEVLLPLVITCAAVAIAFSFGWIWAMKRWGGGMVYFSFFFMVALLAVCAALAFIVKIVVYGVFSIVVAFFYLIYLYTVRHRIPFTQAVMSASSHALQDFPASIWLSYLLNILQVGWFAFWVFAVISIILGARSLNGLGAFFMFCSLYWTSQVLKNISHTTTAGMVASWWLQPNVQTPTFNAFKRATTTSLGTIALGSLIVALIQALQSTLRCLCSCGCYRCFARYIERIVRYFNMYTFSYVAIYGGEFVPSANATIKLFNAHGFSAIINDSLVGSVLYVGSLIGGAISALVALAWVKGEASSKGAGYYTPDIADPDYGVWFQVLYCICGFYAGLLMTAMSMTVFQSAVATTFVVWADDAPALAQHRPAQYKALQDGATKMYGAGAPVYYVVAVQAAPGHAQPAPGQEQPPPQYAQQQPPPQYAQQQPPPQYAQPAPQYAQPYSQPQYAQPAGGAPPPQYGQVAVVQVGVPVAGVGVGVGVGVKS